MDEHTLRTFVASGRSLALTKDWTDHPLGHHLFMHGNFQLLYIEIVRGVQADAGEVLIKERGSPIWQMHYRGQSPKPLSKEQRASLHAFRDHCRALVTPARPYFGPPQYTRSPFDYQSVHFGDFKEFRGLENIYLRGDLAYKLDYHGGIL